jgi:hypothetical protein
MCTTLVVILEGFPIQTNSVTVPSPKDIWTEAKSNLTALPSSVDATLTDLEVFRWGGSISDVIDVYQSIIGMEQVKKIGHSKVYSWLGFTNGKHEHACSNP